MKKERLQKTLEFLDWKLKHNKPEIDEVKIANKLKIPLEDASDIFSKLYDVNAISIQANINCPYCKHNYILKDIDCVIECNDCGEEFLPKSHKSLITYIYIINKEYTYFKSKNQLKPRLSLVTRFKQGDNVNMNYDKKKVFLSYSHVDESFKEKLEKQLSPLIRNKKIESWNDRNIDAGSRLDDEIKKNLEEADIIILLVSDDFIASNYCYETEMTNAMDREQRGECKIMPIIVRPCLWEETPLKDYLLMPKDGKAITLYLNQDIAYLEIVTALKKLL
ncbi:MAG: toll/interleukin-1 receptor domain-containing protein [Clostridioides difficile]|nr:toll/interleukin-1 receptor domain-containing protein [Clostridioides difficile]